MDHKTLCPVIEHSVAANFTLVHGDFLEILSKFGVGIFSENELNLESEVKSIRKFQSGSCANYVEQLIR